jgi:hypothetical protein
MVKVTTPWALAEKSDSGPHEQFGGQALEHGFEGEDRGRDHEHVRLEPCEAGQEVFFLGGCT